MKNRSFLASWLMVAICIINLQALAQSKVQHEFKVVKNIAWANPGGVSLTMDIYTPQTGKSSYPVLIIYHGGGWLINDHSIMDQMSAYVARHSEYVVCNVNYRLLTASNNTTTMNQIIEDAIGAVLWVKEHVGKYNGDPNKIAVSGDSAGGHLAAMVILSADDLKTDGFTGSTLGFNPSYLPKGKTAEQIVSERGAEVQAAVLNYPATDIYGFCLGTGGDGGGAFETSNNMFWKMGGADARGIFGNGIDAVKNANYYKAVSPVYRIPKSSEKRLAPQLCAVGSKDDLTTPSLVKAYADSVKKAGHPVEYWVYEGRPHAYLDSGENEYLKTSFKKDAPPALDKIIQFLDSVFEK